MSALLVEIWSDVACPWCWVGKRRLEAAIEAFDSAVAMIWRAFELDPNAPREAPEQVDYVERLATKYRTTREQAQEMIDRMVATGQASGLVMRFDRIRPCNTFDAHRLLVWAREKGPQTALKERLFSAYLHEGRSVSDRDVLADLTAEIGLDREEARAVLHSEAYAEEVRAEERSAAEIGATGVPFFVFGGRLALSGASPVELLVDSMRRASAAGASSTKGLDPTDS